MSNIEYSVRISVVTTRINRKDSTKTESVYHTIVCTGAKNFTKRSEADKHHEKLANALVVLAK